MSWAARLQALDDRVLGKPEPPSVDDYRRGTLVGVSGIAAMVVCAAVTGVASFLSAAAGFVGLTAVTAVRWHRLSADSRAPAADNGS